MVPEPSHHPLAHIRRKHGWTLADVAEIVARRSGLNMASWRQKVHRWERRGVIPEPAAQHALADELGVPRHVVDQFGWPAWLHTIDDTESIDAPWTSAQASETLHLVTESAASDHRGYLIVSGHLMATTTAAMFKALPPVIQSGLDGHLVGTELIQALQQRIQTLWLLDDLLGGGACLDAITADLHLIATITRNANHNTTTEQALYTVAASALRFAGFAAFDNGQHAAAQRFWHAGLRAAHTANNPSEAAHILSNAALQDIYTNHGRHALDLLDAARNNTDNAHKTVLSMLDCWQARAHATRGESHQAATMLNLADQRWSNRRPEDDPDWIYWMPRPSLTAEAGTALIHIGHTDQAQRLLHQGMAELPTGAYRDRTLYFARLSQTQLMSGDLDQAAETARSAIDTAAATQSSRTNELAASIIGLLPKQDHRTAELRARYKARTSNAR